MLYWAVSMMLFPDFVTEEIAGAAMALSSVSVVLNALRQQRVKL